LANNPARPAAAPQRQAQTPAPNNTAVSTADYQRAVIARLGDPVVQKALGPDKIADVKAGMAKNNNLPIVKPVPGGFELYGASGNLVYRTGNK
jgi:hypothetical protein